MPFAAVGPGAKDAVPTLMDMQSMFGFQVYYMQTWCLAIGSIGPAASEAIPISQSWANPKNPSEFADPARAALKNVRGESQMHSWPRWSWVWCK